MEYFHRRNQSLKFQYYLYFLKYNFRDRAKFYTIKY